MNKERLKPIILWWVGTFIALLLIIFNTIFYEMIKSSFYSRVQNSLAVISNQVKDNLIPNQDKIITIPPKLDYPINPVMIQVFSGNMKIIAKNAMFMNINLTKYLQSKENFFIVHTKKYGKLAIFISRIISPIKAYIVITTPMYKIDIKLKDILIKMIILNPILLVVLLIITSWMVDRILNPIKEITKVANEISVGDLDRTIPLPRQQDEIYDLVQAFNKMVIRLRNGIEMIERFNSDVSHELKTPLTVLKGEIEIALRKDRDIEYYKNTLNIALKEVNYLIEMVEEILLFTKIEQEREMSIIQVDELLLSVMSNLSIKAKQKNIKLHLQNLDIVTMKSNSVLLKIIFVNIIDNAIKYTENNKNIYISLTDKQDVVIFSVKDEGIGISKEEIDKITERFYRSEKSRNRGIKGFGLGLSIVQKALDILDGEIKFYSDITGTKVDVILRRL